eukprot:TRINITY_DN50272_c0_g1_i1.p1 TRINITY_DN50272_c0_g1~~TRINITY_DN50272_c0_g1_i1.p1  ORF type:complete len:577 (+),score=172.29 TRINITY_DN50272_c0_g1_i1:85-1731(+)
MAYGAVANGPARGLQATDSQKAEGLQPPDAVPCSIPVFSTEQCVDPWPADEPGGCAPPVFSWLKLWRFSGPGLLMSMAYLDPGNLEADLQAGASARYDLLWVLLWATIMGLGLQSLAAKLGVVSGKHLAMHCREFPAPVRWTLWLMAEVALISADCQEVVGSALAIAVLTDGMVPLWLGCILTAVSCFFFMLLDATGVRRLEALFAVLIGTMVSAFGFQFLARPPPSDELITGIMLPRLSRSNFQTAAGLVGAVIMPHNLFLHSALVLSRKVDRDFEGDPQHAKRQVSEAVFYNRVDSSVALGVSFVINMFVVSVFANIRYFNGTEPRCSYEGTTICPGQPSDPEGCGAQIGLFSAGHCLREVYTEWWWIYVWAAGVLAAGQASTVSGTYAGQFILTGFLNMHVSLFQRVIISRAVALVPAVAFAMAAPAHPAEMDQLNEWINVLQSMQIPFAMLPLVYFSFSSSPQHCRPEFATKGRWAALCWLVIALVFAANGSAVYDAAADVPSSWWCRVPLSGLLLLYVVFVGYLLLVCAGVIAVDGRRPAPAQ